MIAGSGRRWPPLTVALKPGSPVRRYLDERFPNRSDIQYAYRESAGRLLIDGHAQPQTVGGAFDWMVRFMVQPRPELWLAAAAARHLPGLSIALCDLAGRLDCPDPYVGRSAATFTGPVPGSAVAPDLLARACWALSLLTDVYRVGPMPGSSLAGLLRPVTAEALLALPPRDGVDELLALRASAEQALLPALARRPGLWAVGPTFAGSALMNADADLVAGGLLVDIKTSLGRKVRDGGRQASLDSQTLLQVLGYVLLDFPDEYRIREVGVYNGRYGHLTTWPLNELLAELAGRTVELQDERVVFARLLTAGPTG